MAKGSPYSHQEAVRRGLINGRYRIPVNHLISCVAAGAGVGFGSKILDTLPKGRVTIQQVHFNIKFTKMDTNIITTWSANWGLGTVVDADGTLAAGEVDLSTGAAQMAIGPAVGGVIAGARTIVNAPAGSPFNNDAGTLRVALNMSVAAASITDATTGVIKAEGLVELLLGVVP